MTVEKRVIEEIIDQLDVAEVQVQPPSRLEEDLGADSLDKCEIMLRLEEEFGIEIPDEDMDKLKTVGQVIAYVEGRDYGSVS